MSAVASVTSVTDCIPLRELGFAQEVPYVRLLPDGGCGDPP